MGRGDNSDFLRPRKLLGNIYFITGSESPLDKGVNASILRCGRVQKSIVTLIIELKKLKIPQRM